MANMEMITEEAIHGARIKVIGVGGGGNNAVDRMIEAGIDKADFVSVNTDAQQLANAKAPDIIQIGGKLTNGLGAGAKPEIGRQAAEESKDEIKNLMKDTEMVFITAGMGGGTGTGAAPVIAEAAKAAGVLTVAVVTKPFLFEGQKRIKNAEEGIKELSAHVDSIVTIPNDALLKIADKKLSFKDSFKIADEVLRQGVQGIIEVITTEGLINCDFADVQTIMQDSGVAHMGIGIGTGDNAAEDAVHAAIKSPILETSIDNAKSVLLIVTGGENLSLIDVNEVGQVVRNLAADDANIITGAYIDESLKDDIKVTLVATGLENSKKQETPSFNVIDRVAPKFAEPQESVVSEQRNTPPHFSSPSAPSQEEDNKVFTRVTPRPAENEKSSVDVPTFKFFRKG